MLIRNKRHPECDRASIWTPTSHNLQENNVKEEEGSQTQTFRSENETDPNIL